MRRAFVLVTVAAAVVLAAQPGAKGGEQKRTIAEIGAALEAHGITPCEERDWIKKVHGEEGDWAKKAYGDREVPKKSVIAAIRTASSSPIGRALTALTTTMTLTGNAQPTTT